MTYEDIKQRTFDILGYDTAESARLGYTAKIPRIMNECLFRIANSVSPYLREYKIRISRDKLPIRLSMPPDFLSFANDQDAYLNNKNFILTNFIGNDSIILYGNEVPELPQYDIGFSEDLEYTIFYNAYYPQIINGGKEYKNITFKKELPLNEDTWVEETLPVLGNASKGIKAFNIPTHIGHLIPHYIVGQLLSLDDKVRSMTELNEFETMLAQLDTSRNERQRNYQSTRGWY